LPHGKRQMVGPFIFFDHFGPVQFVSGKGMDVRPHPHIGLATVTYLFEGAIMHRDSLGSVQVIRPGDINWMTAGRGVTHSERTPPEARASGQTIHGIQTWFALPQAYEDVEPGFWHHPAATLPVVEAPGLTLRILLGTAYGQTSPVQCYVDTLYVAGEMEAGARLDVPADHAERAVYLAAGSITVDGTAMTPGQMAILTPGMEVDVRADEDSLVLLLGGAPLDGHRFISWNFVASSKERIEEAKQRWREDRFPAVPGETERIPLPER
ncbi:MAG: pirin family protein, partial [Burkholderiales bacterium]|nr:pirin family protein [Burkholderiales bacterium]